MGGRFKEHSCTADYADLGGLEQVNCRLAATELAPEETLKYLVNDLPPERHGMAWHGMACKFDISCAFDFNALMELSFC